MKKSAKTLIWVGGLIFTATACFFAGWFGFGAMRSKPEPDHSVPHLEPVPLNVLEKKVFAEKPKGSAVHMIRQRMIQLSQHQAAWKAINRISMRLIMVDKGDEERTAQQYFDALMDIQEIIGLVNCYDEKMTPCLALMYLNESHQNCHLEAREECHFPADDSPLVESNSIVGE